MDNGKNASKYAAATPAFLLNNLPMLYINTIDIVPAMTKGSLIRNNDDVLKIFFTIIISHVDIIPGYWKNPSVRYLFAAIKCLNSSPAGARYPIFHMRNVKPNKIIPIKSPLYTHPSEYIHLIT